MLVPDASAVLRALTVDGPEGEDARAALESERPLQAPYLLDLEFLSGVRGLVIGDKLEDRRAAQARGDYWDLPIIRHPHRALSQRVWELRHNLSVYDAAYVALAEAVGAPLLTADAAMPSVRDVACDVRTI